MPIPNLRHSLLLALFLSAGALAQDAESVMETLQEKQLERWQGVDLYMVEQSVMGFPIKTWMRRTEVETADGDTQTLFLPISSDTSVPGQCESTMRLTAEQLDSFTAEAGMPGGNDSGNPQEAGTSMASYAAGYMLQFEETAELMGREDVDGRSAFHLRSDQVEQVQSMMEGEEYRTDAINIWIDTEEYVPLKMLIEATVTSAEGSRPMTIETRLSDYRRVPDSNLYESFTQSVAMNGMLSPEQEEQMQEAQAQITEFEQSLADMDPGQRAIMEQMMGGQLENLRSMASGGGFNATMQTDRIVPNPAYTGDQADPCPDRTGGNTVSTSPASASAGSAAAVAAAAASPAAGGASGAPDLNVMVQTQLKELGYYNGEAHGNLDTATIVAISQYQAASGLEVDGQVSPQLAGRLAAESSGQTGGAAAATSGDSLLQAQQACLQEKIQQAESKQKKKRGFGRLLSGVTRAAAQIGGGDTARDMAATTAGIYNANATAEDFAAAARDLGITEDEIEACRNP